MFPCAPSAARSARRSSSQPAVPPSIARLLLLVLATSASAARAQDLGPVDGRDLPAADIERVAVGDRAPLFTLESYDRGPVSLADFRGNTNVVLVFYRGHW